MCFIVFQQKSNRTKMNRLINITLLSSLILMNSACSKHQIDQLPMASVNIVNTVTGGTTVGVASYYETVGNNANVVLSYNPGSSIYVYPAGDSLHPYYQAQGGKDINIAGQDIYTLFLGGTPSSAEGVLVKENLPVRTDSTGGIRFINLSPNAPAVNVTLSTTPTVNEFAGVSYKDITAFKSYPALSSTTSYTFQIRNASTNALITSISISGTSLLSGIPRFRNITLVLRGMVSGSPSAGITRVNHYL